MISKENSKVVMNSRDIPAIKLPSAIFSYRMLLGELLLIDRNESRQLVMKRMIAIVVISSMIVVLDTFNTFKEVSTIKQMPNKFDDAFKICGALSLLSFIQ
jgi:hypothetical protein